MLARGWLKNGNAGEGWEEFNEKVCCFLESGRGSLDFLNLIACDSKSDSIRKDSSPRMM